MTMKRVSFLDAPDKLTATEAAKLLHCHVNKVIRMIDRGDLPAWKVGRNVLVLRRHVRRIIKRLPVRVAPPRRCAKTPKWAKDILDKAGI